MRPLERERERERERDREREREREMYMYVCVCVCVWGGGGGGGCNIFSHVHNSIYKCVPDCCLQVVSSDTDFCDWLPPQCKPISDDDKLNVLYLYM